MNQLLFCWQDVEFTLGDESEKSRKEMSSAELTEQLDRLIQDNADNQRIFDWVEVRIWMHLYLTLVRTSEAFLTSFSFSLGNFHWVLSFSFLSGVVNSKYTHRHWLNAFIGAKANGVFFWKEINVMWLVTVLSLVSGFGWHVDVTVCRATWMSSKLLPACLSECWWPASVSQQSSVSKSPLSCFHAVKNKRNEYA